VALMGVVTGDIHAKSVTIYGTVMGNITAEMVTLKMSSSLIGNVRSSNFTVEDGAELEGLLSINQKKSHENL
jgi:cytoskeletal protein CcmA (bactofilin family)